MPEIKDHWKSPHNHAKGECDITLIQNSRIKYFQRFQIEVFSKECFFYSFFLSFQVDPKENALTIRGDIRAREKEDKVFRSFDTAGTRLGGGKNNSDTNKSVSKTVVRPRPKKLSLQEQMLRDAVQATDTSNDNLNALTLEVNDSKVTSSSSSQLLGIETQTRTPSFTSPTLSNIVRKPLSPSTTDTFSLDDVGTPSKNDLPGSLISHIEELD